MRRFINYRYSLILLFVLGFQFVKSQNDVITTTKGDKVICNIIKEDSTTVYFKLGGSLSTVQASLSRTDIVSIEYAPKTKEPMPVLSINPAQVERDDYVAPTLTVTASQSVVPLASKKKVNGLALNFGLSAPLGKFRSTNLDTNEIGPANNGQVVSLSFVHLAKNNFGVTLSGFLSRNELNTSPITEKYQAYTDSLWIADKAEWRAAGVQLGLIYLKEIKDFSIYGKLNAGYLTLKYPELKISVHSNNYLQFEGGSSDALCFGSSAGIGYTVLENLKAHVDVSYMYASCKFSEVLIQGEEPAIGFPKKISTLRRNVKQNYQTVFITLGVSYWF